MSAADVIEQIQKLPVPEQRKVADFVRRLEPVRKADEIQSEVSEEFKRAADEVFTKNAELFRKLAQ
jgi:hypothetical protein